MRPGDSGFSAPARNPDWPGRTPGRSSKRDWIVDVFLRQQGHLSADDLVDLLRREAPAGASSVPISRATVYRTLQWMVDAGIARKVDTGEGRVRFEHSYRHPRHFHLICRTCSRSFEFLSSDIEALIEEVASARSFEARQSVLQIHGTCDACRTGRAPSAGGDAQGLVFARDALRIAIATHRSGLEFYAQAARTTRDLRGRRVFDRLADQEKVQLAMLEVRYADLLQEDAQLEARPTFLFFRGAANGLFAAGAGRLADGVEDREAIMMAIRCERGSHQFFKRYGERFEDAASRRIFLSCADSERAHLALLIREYRALVERQRRRRSRAGGRRRPGARRHAAGAP